LNPYLYEHANIREQVSWVHDGEGATSKAEGLVSAAVAKTEFLQPLRPMRVEALGHATVIGGGVAGLKAARDLSKRGIKVTLIEKTPFLGGNASRLDRVFPSGEKAADLIRGLAADVLDNPRIEILTCSEVRSSEGYVGNFKLSVTRRPPGSHVDLERAAKVKEAGAAPGEFVPFIGIQPLPIPPASESRDLSTGAIVLATGFQHYSPFKGEYGYGDNPEVITLPDLIQIMAADQSGQGKLFIGDRSINSVAFLHCVGSRQIPGMHERPDGRPLNEFCSRVCCTATLQAAIEMKSKYPETVVYELYRDIQQVGELFLHALTQKRFGQCTDRKQWWVHLLIMTGYSSIFLMVVVGIRWFQRDRVIDPGYPVLSLLMSLVGY
jgi:heterodisulfide reductase subunit A2